MVKCRIDSHTYTDVVSVEINKAGFKYDGKDVWYVDVVIKDDTISAFATVEFYKCAEWIKNHCEEV